MFPRGPRRTIKAAGWLLLIPLLLPGCAGLYFRDVSAVPEPMPRHTLPEWPYKEYWTGVIFNGEKIGLTHLAMFPPGEAGGPYELRSEALLAFHFLGFDKKVVLKAQDWISDDLRLQRFVHEYDLDGNLLRLSGRVEGRRLLIERESTGRTTMETIPLTEAVYPTSAIVLYPTLHGLGVGRHYTYLVYDGQRQQLARVSQAVGAYQESELFDGPAFEVATSMDGHESTTWINEQGEPVLEMAWLGILISTLESESQAKSYLARATVNKRDVLVEFSRVRTSVVLPRPRELTSLRIDLQGLPETFAMPSDQLQHCNRQGKPSNGEVQCLIRSTRHPDQGERNRLRVETGLPRTGDAELARFLAPTPVIDSQDQGIRRTAREIVTGTTNPITMIRGLVGWIQENVEQEPVDVFSSLQVLEGRKAECQGLTWLYAAFTRSLGIPTRVTNGLVYSAELDGFLYHTWAESYVDSGWLPVDPTFGQVGVDATHIKLIDGDRPADLYPLVDLIGRIRVQILSFDPS